MIQTIKLTENELKHIINESVKRILNEDFINNDLNALVSEHGGLMPADKYPGKYDARTYNANDNIRQAKVSGYIEPEQMEVLELFNKFSPITSQLLYCRDGGAIVIDCSNTNLNTTNYSRLKNHLEDTGEKMYQNGALRDIQTRQRKEDHYSRRNVRTTGPNAGKKRMK